MMKSEKEIKEERDEIKEKLKSGDISPIFTREQEKYLATKLGTLNWVLEEEKDFEDLIEEYSKEEDDDG